MIFRSPPSPAVIVFYYLLQKCGLFPSLVPHFHQYSLLYEFSFPIVVLTALILSSNLMLYKPNLQSTELSLRSLHKTIFKGFKLGVTFKDRNSQIKSYISGMLKMNSLHLHF